MKRKHTHAHIHTQGWLGNSEMISCDDNLMINLFLLVKISALGSDIDFYLL